MLIKFERRDPSLPPIKRVHVPRVPERELSAAEANVAIVDGIFAVIFGLLALLVSGIFFFPPSIDAILVFSGGVIVALMWCGAAYAMTRGHWSRWWIQLPVLGASFFALVYILWLSGQ